MSEVSWVDPTDLIDKPDPIVPRTRTRKTKQHVRRVFAISTNPIRVWKSCDGATRKENLNESGDGDEVVLCSDRMHVQALTRPKVGMTEQRW